MSETNFVRLSKTLTLGAMAGVGVELTGADVEALVRTITGMGEEIETLNARIAELEEKIDQLTGGAGMSEIPKVFDGFEQKLAQVLSFTVVPLNKQELKKAVEEWLIYISSTVERADKANARIAELEAAQRWIPVSERLPFGEKVLVLWKDRTIHLDWTFLDGGGYYWWNSGQSNVTHWMPLPQPPEVQE